MRGALIVRYSFSFSPSSFNSTYISCESAEGSSSECIMEVVVNINEDEYDNDNKTFQYTSDPVFTSVTPQDVILA